MSPVPYFLVRPVTGTTGETHRVTHMVAADHGQYGNVIRTKCGETFHPAELEQLSKPTGMPCIACMLASQSPRHLSL
ncbi:hypothetical protein HFP15_32505 [Amycolatopsis sp. K13G38]|uniref:DUF3039 domain-containing protein n=1 Tax=Amycolatopsis acididurans TaxID=2724524 RepID=A0ABX1JGP8_9PSEU|nr:hypothetical protein [Amycolatopsis acididurans]NKQ57595.1 hypothetical protein [Amycolatopsis acididurans]